MKIEKGILLKSGSSIYKIIGDFSEVDSEIDYEMKQLFPDTGKVVTTSQEELANKMARNKVKKINHES